MSVLPERVEKEIETIAASEGLELVHIEYRKQGHGFLLRIDIDKEGGVTVEDCELVSHQVSAFLDVDDVVPAEYELQVSSPGLDRKFYKLSDYQKFLGRLVRVRTSKAIRGLHVIVGRLKEFNGETIVVTDPVMKRDPDYVVPAAYELQVSSPGLDRKFYKLSDYEKFIGRLVRVRTSKAIRGLHVIVGRLKEFNGETIVVTDPVMKKDPDYVVPLADIKETRLEVEI